MWCREFLGIPPNICCKAKSNLEGAILITQWCWRRGAKLFPHIISLIQTALPLLALLKGNIDAKQEPAFSFPIFFFHLGEGEGEWGRQQLEILRGEGLITLFPYRNCTRTGPPNICLKLLFCSQVSHSFHVIPVCVLKPWEYYFAN